MQQRVGVQSDGLKSNTNQLSSFAKFGAASWRVQEKWPSSIGSDHLFVWLFVCLLAGYTGEYVQHVYSWSSCGVGIDLVRRRCIGLWEFLVEELLASCTWASWLAKQRDIFLYRERKEKAQRSGYAIGWKSKVICQSLLKSENHGENGLIAIGSEHLFVCLFFGRHEHGD